MSEQPPESPDPSATGPTAAPFLHAAKGADKISPGVTQRDTQLQPSIVIDRVSHSYGTGDTCKQVLFENELTLWSGEIVIMTGPSGSGKTTLLTLIGGLRSVQEGSLRVLGKEMKGLAPAVLESVRSKVGFVFQAHDLFDSLTAYQTMQLAMQLHPYADEEFRTRPIRMLTELGLEERVHYKPENLSGGQRQRGAIGRALINQPQLILADEPTAALDKDLGRNVVNLLQKLAKEHGSTTLIVTHDNRIVNMVDGHVVSDVDVQESLAVGQLLQSCDVFKNSAPQLLATISGAMKRERFEAGQSIIRQGEAGDKFYIIRAGRGDVSKQQEDGAVRSLVKLGSGAYFGELALIDDTPRAATVTAMEPTELLVLGKARFLEAVQSNSDLVKQLRKAYFGSCSWGVMAGWMVKRSRRGR
ncbi:MAG: ATP-binding cassette domain-containing protein [Candidatus Synoicihabitans palmerolidicus]|nr:ATP-binding cassette domain-containing protein [Candidatus Synoicihabitans palmerolidicus]